MNNIIEILTYKMLWLVAAMGLLFTAGSFFHPVFVPFALICVLGLFDQIGFGIGIQRRDLETGKGVDAAELHQSAYHITGFIANLIALGLVWLLEKHINGTVTAWYCIIAFVLPYWFGCKDVFYYFGLGEPMSKHMFWFYWTPLGIGRTLRLTFKRLEQITIFEEDDIEICELHRDSSIIAYLKEVFLTHKQRVWLTREEVVTQNYIGLIVTTAYIIYHWMGGLF